MPKNALLHTQTMQTTAIMQHANYRADKPRDIAKRTRGIHMVNKKVVKRKLCDHISNKSEQKNLTTLYRSMQTD
jgi:hypothetical protein